MVLFFGFFHKLHGKDSGNASKILKKLAEVLAQVSGS
jgi:hypothetical protein